MQRSTLVSLIIAAAVAGAVPGCRKGRPSPKEIVEKAITAHGGEANLWKRRLGKTKGFEKGKELNLVWEESFDFPEKFARLRTGTAHGRHLAQEILLKDGVFSLREGVQPVQEREAADVDRAGQTFGLLFLLWHLRQNETELSTLDDAEADGSPAAGIRHSAHGMSNDYYFNKQNGLLAKTVVRRPMQAGGHYTAENLFGDYRKVDGVILPHRLRTYLLGELMVEWRITEIQLVDRLDEKVFTLP